MSCCIKSQTIKNLHCMYARGVGPQLKEQGCSLYLLEVEKTVFISLKVPLKSNSRYPFFTFSYTKSLSERSCQISSYYEHQNSCLLDLYFLGFTAAINFPCFP